jgi:hypothetical protein
MASSVGNDSADWAAPHINEELSTLNWIMEGMIKIARFRLERIDVFPDTHLVLKARLIDWEIWITRSTKNFTFSVIKRRTKQKIFEEKIHDNGRECWRKMP